MDNTIPIGLIVQVRRDDRYRCLARSTQKGFSYFCAYYISKDTPKGPSGFTGGFPLAQDDAGSLDQPPSTDQPATNGDSDDDSKLNYDQMMDKNIEDNVQFAPGATWEGNTFSFDATQLDAGNDQDDPLSFAFSGSALDDLKHSEDDFTADANAA